MSHIATDGEVFYSIDEASERLFDRSHPQEAPAPSTDRTRSSNGGWSNFRNTKSG